MGFVSDRSCGPEWPTSSSEIFVEMRMEKTLTSTHRRRRDEYSGPDCGSTPAIPTISEKPCSGSGSRSLRGRTRASEAMVARMRFRLRQIKLPHQHGWDV